jgi:outer membrane biosynthesis protein TonB
MAKVSRAALVAAAEELNELMGLDPEINVSDNVKDAALIKEIVENAGDLVVADKISYETFKTLEALEIDLPMTEPKAPKGVKPAAKKEVEPAPEEKIEEEVVEKKKPDSKKPFAKKEIEPDPADSDEDDKKSKASKKPAAGKKEKKEKGPSAYGTTVAAMCEDPDMSFADLLKILKKKGIDTDNKSAINTGYSVVRKIVASLRENKLMK